jgi:hypothetical protein
MGLALFIGDGPVDELGHVVLWEVWQRCAMGLKPSPFQAVQAMMVAEETHMRRSKGS